MAAPGVVVVVLEPARDPLALGVLLWTLTAEVEAAALLAPVISTWSMDRNQMSVAPNWTFLSVTAAAPAGSTAPGPS